VVVNNPIAWNRENAFKVCFVQVLKYWSMYILMCCELPHTFYSPSLHGLMNQVKSMHNTIDHFGSVKNAELVDPMEKDGNST